MPVYQMAQGRPRHNPFTYDEARRVRRRLANVQIAMRELAYSLAECPEVAEYLLGSARSKYLTVIGQVGPSQRIIYQELGNWLLAEAVKAAEGAEGQP